MWRVLYSLIVSKRAREEFNACMPKQTRTVSADESQRR